MLNKDLLLFVVVLFTCRSLTDLLLYQEAVYRFFYFTKRQFSGSLSFTVYLNQLLRLN